MDSTSIGFRPQGFRTPSSSWVVATPKYPSATNLSNLGLTQRCDTLLANRVAGSGLVMRGIDQACGRHAVHGCSTGRHRPRNLIWGFLLRLQDSHPGPNRQKVVKVDRRADNRQGEPSSTKSRQHPEVFLPPPRSRTDRGLCRLSSGVEGDPVFSMRCGRQPKLGFR